MSKPREFWIRADSHKIDGVFYAWNDNQEHFDCINVIEKKAYDALLAQNKLLVEALESCKAAMAYAYEDHSDRYYINVLEQIRQALEKVSK